MRIIVFGAAGSVGSRVVAEALFRGHEVGVVLRKPANTDRLPAGVKAHVGDARSADDVAKLSAGHDVVISATPPAPGAEQELVAMAKALLAGVRQAGVRLLLVGGAASLRVPDTGGRVVDDPRYVSPAYLDITLASSAQFEVCVADTQAD
jgi:putative NADH-flavin reductase